MALEFKRGIAAIEEAAKTGKKFQPFAPQIGWKDQEERYILFLTNIEDAATVLLHEWIDCGEKSFGEGKNKKTFTDWGFFISRKDPAIGEESDPLTDKGSNPKKRILAAAVELEPIKGDGPRPVGFTVKTEEYTRKTDDGDEEVIAPVIGVITQASKNFFKLLVSHAETEGPIEDAPFKVRRIGGDSETAYAFTPYFDQPVDLSDLLAYIDGVSYLNDEDTWGEIEAALESGDEKEAAMGIGAVLLNKRLNELADWDTYQEMTSHIESIESKYEKGDKKKTDRPARRSQRDGASSAQAQADVKAQASAKSDRFAEIKALAEKKKAERAKASA